MKKFFFRSLYLLLPLIPLILFMEYNLARIPNSYSYKRECFETGLDSTEVLLVGSSQTYYGLNPDVFSLRTFNLSNISQDLYYDRQLVMRYLDSMPRLRYVVISISYFSFGYAVIDGTEAWRVYYYSQFWDIDHPDEEPFDLKKISKFFLYTPNASLSYLLKGFRVNLTEHMNSSGFYSASAQNGNPDQISKQSGQLRVKLHDALFRENRFNENRTHLEMLVSALRERGIVPLIITPPVLPTYSGCTDPLRLKRNSVIIESICSRYHCVYHNFFTDSRFVKADFTDNDHLNSTGAAKFSKIVNDLMVTVH